MTNSPISPLELSQLECLQDPETVAMYLEECLADGDIELFQAALQDVAKVQGVEKLSVRSLFPFNLNLDNLDEIK